MDSILDLLRLALPIELGPEMTMSVLRSLALCGFFAASGWVLSRRLLGTQRLVALVPLSVIVGVSAFVFLANALAYAVGVATAFRLAAILLLLAAGYLILRPLRRPEPLIAEGLVGTAIYLVVAGVFFIVVVANYIVVPTMDYYIHYDAANRLAMGQFPLMNVATPDLHAKYHYGVDLLAAAFMRLGALPVEGAFLFIGVGIPVALFLMVYAIAREATGSRYMAFIPALLAAFNDGLQFLTPRVQDWHLQRWARELNGITLTERTRLAEYLGSLLPNEFTSYPRFIINPHALFGLALLFAVFYLLLVRKDRSWPGLLLAGALLAALALVEESLMVFAAAGLAVGFVTDWRQRLPWRRLFLIGCLTAVTVAIQGGVITDILFRSAGGEGLTQAFSWNWPVLVWFNNLIPVQPGVSPFWLEHYLLILGIPLLLLPALALWTLWRGEPIDKGILTVAVLGFLIPHVVAYTYSPDLYRLIRYGHLAASVGLGFMLVWLARQHRFLVPVLAISLLVMLAPLRIAVAHVFDDRQVTLGRDYEARLSLSSVFRTAPHMDTYDFMRGRERPFLLPEPLILDLRRSLSPESRVLTDQPMEVTLATGAYVPHKPLDAISYILARNPGPEYIDALFSLSPRAMQTLKITHIVMSDWWFAHLPESLQAHLDNRSWFRLTYSTESQAAAYDGRWHRVYEVQRAYFDRPDHTPTIADLEALIPANASVYISPGIPHSLRWSFEYALRSRQLFAATQNYNHTTATIRRNPIDFSQSYDFALLNAQDESDRWFFWTFARQDSPLAWGATAADVIWQNYDVSVVALPVASFPTSGRGGGRHLVPVTAEQPLQTILDPVGTLANQQLALRVKLFSSEAAIVDVAYGESSTVIRLIPGLTTLTTPVVSPPLAVRIQPRDGGSVSANAALIPKTPARVLAQNPSIDLRPRIEDGQIIVAVAYMNPGRVHTGLLEPRWTIERLDLVLDSPWYASEQPTASAWSSTLALEAERARFHFSLDPLAGTATETKEGGTEVLPKLRQSRPSPRQRYVLYFNIHAPGAGRQTALPLATFYLGDGAVSDVEVFPATVSLGF